MKEGGFRWHRLGSASPQFFNSLGRRARDHLFVMAGPRIESGGDPAINVFAKRTAGLAEKDARIKSAHDGVGV